MKYNTEMARACYYGMSLVLFTIGLLVSTDRICLKVFDGLENVTKFENCKAVMKDENVIVKCYCSCPEQWHDYSTKQKGLLVDFLLKPTKEVSPNRTQPKNIFCLKLHVLELRIQTTDKQMPIANEGIFPISTYMYCTDKTNLQFDFKVVFDPEYPLATMSFNETCSSAIPRKNSNESFAYAYDYDYSENLLDELGSFMTLEWFNPSLKYHSTLLYLVIKSHSINSQSIYGLYYLAETQIKTLGIHSKAIRVIEDYSFPELKSLLKLDLSQCGITTIGKEAFNELANLQVLMLQGNKLKALPVALRSLHNLQLVNFSGNHWKANVYFKFKKRVLTKLTELRTLDLSNMKLEGFWKNVDITPKLRKLYLSNCSLSNASSMEVLARKFPNLRRLDISHNDLTELNDTFFYELTKLKVLNLSGNRLFNFPYNEIIEKLPNLEEFLMSANGIREFLPIALKKQSSLKKLDLHSNEITLWKQTKIQSDGEILYVMLAGNNITEVTSHMLRDFSQLKQVTLVGNQFDCTYCKIEMLLNWLNTTDTQTDWFTDTYRCAFPKKHYQIHLAEIPSESCIEKAFDWIVNILTPIVVIAVILSFIGIILYVHRWHVRYCCYLFQSRVKKHRHQIANNSAVFKYDAFVSYCSEDVRWVAERLVPIMEEQAPKLHTCIHERDFELGETIVNNILDCIDSSQKTIFIVSQHSIQSEWCEWELQMAKHKLIDDKRDVLLLVLLGEINVEEVRSKLLKRLMARRTYIQWPENETGQKLFWRRLKDAIGKCRCINNAAIQEAIL